LESYRKENEILKEDISIYKEKCMLLNENLTEISDKFKHTVEVIETCFDDIKNLNISLNNTNLDNVDAALSSRVQEIKGSMLFIEQNFKEKSSQLELYVTKMVDLKSEFDKIKSTVQNKENDLIYKNSELDKLHAEINQITNERDDV
jgi:chromosome segregation ATPase